MKAIIPVWQIILGLIGLVYAPSLYAQTPVSGIIKITYPQTRAVFQRDNNNLSTIYISGSYTQPIDSLQARVVAETVGQGTSTNWQTIQRSPQGGVFRGKVVASNGWYRLQVQAFAGSAVLTTDEVRRVGVGEVFIITGQSNAQGLDGYGGIGATEDRVNCVSFNNITTNSVADPPAPVFEQLGANSVIGPRGKTAWCWGVLGDLLVQQYNVPVLFINTAWESTTSRNWNESTQNIQTVYWFNSVPLPPGMPYANLLLSLRYYASLQGMRSILWQQGESDNIPFNVDQTSYRNNLQFLINKTRADTQRYPAWILARSSVNSTQDGACVTRCNGDPNCLKSCYNYRAWPNIINGQNDIINTYNNNVYPGPVTDNIQIPRIDGVHFSNEGLRQLGQAWYQSMTPIFFSTSLPLLPQEQPAVTVTCSTTAGAVSLALPTGYASYTWVSGQTGRTISVTQAGTYQATLKDFQGNTYLSPQVTINAPLVPATPAISLPGNPGVAASVQQQICTDSVLTLTSTSPPTNALRWSNGTTGRTTRVATVGTYSVQATNVYGCQSGTSAAVSLIIRPRVSPPTVAQVGPYSLLATLPASAIQTNFFSWRQGNQLLPAPTGPDFKGKVNGTYSARARGVFVLGTDSLSCFSAFSAPATFTKYGDSDDGVVVYPNPTTGGSIAVETADDWEDATIRVIGLNGKEVIREYVGLLRERRVLNLSGITGGLYIVNVKGTGLEVSRRIWIMN